MSEVQAEAPKKRSTKAVEPVAEGPKARTWEEVVPKIRELRDAGKTVPEIALELDLPYVLVNQVVLQSYKMTVRTKEAFEGWERQRLAKAGA